jgi:Major Facilitator Superfamily
MTVTDRAPGRRARMAVAWRSGPLSVGAFRLLTAGQFASTVGDYCYAVALPWLVLSNHGSTVLLGTLLACYGVPRMVLIPVGGVLADKLGPRTTMLAADTLRCACVAALAVLAADHTVSLATLGPLSALTGAGEGLFIPASMSMLPVLLDPGRLAAGTALFTAGQQAGSLIGPAVGGVLVAVAGPAPAFAVDAATFAVSALTLVFIPRRGGAVEGAAIAAGAGEAGGGGSGGSDGVGGSDGSDGVGGSGGGVFALLRRSRVLQVILVVVFVANLASGGLGDVALPALAHERFGASGYGVLLACLAAGAIGGSLAAARGSRLRRPASVASAAFLVMAAAMALVPFGGIAVAGAALLVMGAGNSLGNTLMLPRLQLAMPPQLLGRVMAMLMFCAFGSFPVSVAVSGVLIHHLGPTAFFPIAGAMVTVAILGALTQRDWRDLGATDVVGAVGVAVAPGAAPASVPGARAADEHAAEPAPEGAPG